MGGVNTMEYCAQDLRTVTHLILWHPFDILMRQILISRWGNRGPESWSDLLKVTDLAKAKFEPAVWGYSLWPVKPLGSIASYRTAFGKMWSESQSSQGGAPGPWAWWVPPPRLLPTVEFWSTFLNTFRNFLLLSTNTLLHALCSVLCCSVL